MTKRELIDEIVELNPTATPEFLADFEQSDLAEYLQHLQWVAEPPAAEGKGDLTPPAVSLTPEPQPADEPALKPVVAVVADTDAESPFAQQPVEEDSQAWLF